MIHRFIRKKNYRKRVRESMLIQREKVSIIEKDVPKIEDKKEAINENIDNINDKPKTKSKKAKNNIEEKNNDNE